MASKARRQRGEGGLYQRSSDGLWVGTIELGYSATGVRLRRPVYSKTQAGAMRKKREAQARFDAGQTNPDRSLTVAAWLNRWLEDIATPRNKPRTIQTYRNAIQRYIIPTIGRIRLEDLQPHHVREMHKANERAGLAAATMLGAHRVLGKALVDAEREGLIVNPPHRRVDAPRLGDVEQAVLTAEEARAVLRSVIPDRLGSRWAAALLLGARQGECLGLTWDRVDLERGTVDLAWQLQRIPFRHGCSVSLAGPECGRQRAAECPRGELAVPRGYPLTQLVGGLCLTRPKSRAGRRMIPLPEPLRLWLVERSRNTEPRPYDLVWTELDGSPISPNTDNEAWHGVLSFAGIRDVDLKAARHTTASVLMEIGEDVEVIRTIMGHSVITTTRNYQHVAQPLQTKALGSLGDFLTKD